LIRAGHDPGMTAAMQATEVPTVRLAAVVRGPFATPARREGRPVTAPEEAARELDVEVTRLLRVRGGELAEPLLWQRPSHRREVESIVGQLMPIRSRLALVSSWERESRRGSAVRLAYAIVWLRLAQRQASEFGPRLRRGAPRAAARPRLLRGRG
jgi:hypothetical protein